ncbi:hypothetical protein CERSUDRAFT_103860 [Gelatoporia subvermispora B]|uniref:Uncharacterized protein n=1 Tax=Ceriporiopsis subvermispora (strain B) TaxID=914234 RepID=M2PTE8_CERS8|nr:hypothetical protein CERSUDRAFT_103860 [Gelatoporia subvermispora B]
MDGIGESSVDGELGEERPESSVSDGHDVEQLSSRARARRGVGDAMSGARRERRDWRGQLVGVNEPIDSQLLTAASNTTGAGLDPAMMAETVEGILECLRDADRLRHPRPVALDDASTPLAPTPSLHISALKYFDIDAVADFART